MSTRAFSKYTDGYYGTPRLISRRPREYPFDHLGDITTATYVGNYVVDQAAYVRPALGTVDPDAAGFYLVKEGKLDIEQGDLATFSRTYASVPPDQVSYVTRKLNKPAPTGTAYGYSERSPTLDYSSAYSGTSVLRGSYLWTGNNRVFGSLYNVVPNAVVLPSGGTFTITYKTSTTAALAYNETSLNIAAALNALADVITDGLTVAAVTNLTGTGTLTLTVTGGAAARFTADGTSLSPADARKLFTLLNTPSVQILAVAQVLPLPAHGYAGTEELLIAGTTGGSNIAYPLRPSLDWAVRDANQLWVSQNLASFGSRFGVYYRDYTPGTDEVKVRRTQSFWLPGVTGGITTGEDIPAADTLQDDSAFLDEVIANPTGYVDYDATDLGFWMGPIYTRSVDAIKFDTL